MTICLETFEKNGILFKITFKMFNRIFDFQRLIYFELSKLTTISITR